MRVDPKNRTSPDPHSKKNSYGTPQELFEFLDAEFNFNIDGAANTQNHLCDEWFGPGGECPDALKCQWETKGTGRTVVFVNPPYGMGMIRPFVEKAVKERSHGVCVVVLLPSSTETAWFQVCHQMADEIRFLPKRLSFIDPDTKLPVNGNMHASVVVVFRPYGEGPAKYRYQMDC